MLDNGHVTMLDHDHVAMLGNGHVAMLDNGHVAMPDNGHVAMLDHGNDAMLDYGNVAMLAMLRAIVTLPCCHVFSHLDSPPGPPYDAHSFLDSFPEWYIIPLLSFISSWTIF